MELVQQGQLPVAVQRGGWVGVAGAQAFGQGGGGLGSQVGKLGGAVGPLVAALAGEHAAVVLKVHLAVPAGQVGLRLVKVLFQFVKVGGCVGQAGLGRTGDALLHAAVDLQHFSGHTAAAVAVAIALQHILGQLLVLKALPAAHDLPGVQQAVVGRVEARLRVEVGALVVVLGGDKVGQYLGAVDAAPAGQIVGHTVGIVPGHLGGHEPLHAALGHNLGQRAAETEGIRQPQDVPLFAEFPAEKFLPVQELADQTLAAGHVAVGFQPHTALRFPVAVGDAGADLLKQRRAVFAHKIIELRLAGQELVLGVAVHQIVDGGKAADGLFPRLGQRPEPGHVDVGVADTVHRDRLPQAEALVKFLFHIAAGGGDAGVERGAVRVAQVEHIQCFFQIPPDADGVGVALVQLDKHLVRGFQVVVQAGDLIVPHGSLDF